MEALLAVAMLLCPDGASATTPSGIEVPKLAWLADLGAEGAAATPRRMRVDRPLWINVPGAAIAFHVDGRGGMHRSRRVATDYASAYSTAATPRGTVVGERDGAISLWTRSAPGDPGELRWRRPLGRRVMSVAWSGGDRVWAATRDGYLIALGSQDGAVLWWAEIGGRAEASPVESDTDVYVATKSRSLYRIDAETGSVRWRSELADPVIHPPVVTKGRVPLAVCGGWGGELAAFDVESGSRRWSVELGARLAGPVIAGSDRLAAVTEDGAVHLFDLDGRPLWRAPEVAEGPASLSLLRPGQGREGLLVVSKRPALLDLSTGRPLESYPENAEADLRRRFNQARIEGEKTWSEAEKGAALEREAFPISGPLFGPARIIGNGVAFGTEEGWIYLFDLGTLRPTFRYRAGRPASGMPTRVGDRFVAAAGEEVFALAAETGRILWRRGLGGAVKQVATGQHVAVLAGDRLSTLDPEDGSRGWTQKTRARFVSEPVPGFEEAADLWLVDDGRSGLEAIDEAGRTVARLETGGTPLPPVPLPGVREWVVATREGRLFGVSSVHESGETGAELRLERTWSRELDGPVRDLRTAGAHLLVRLEAGNLIGMEPRSGRELWRVRLADHEDYTVAADERTLLVFGGDTVRGYGLESGRILVAHATQSQAVGADLRGGTLRWLDRSGRLHGAVLEDGRRFGPTNLGVSLEMAAPSSGGFLVRTPAGEIGFVIDALRADAAAAPDMEQPTEMGGGR